MAWENWDGSQWVDVRDPEVCADGSTFDDVLEAWVWDGAQWTQFYIREIASAMSVNVSGGTVTGDTVTISGAVLDSSNRPVGAEGDVLVEAGYNDGSWTAVGTVPLNAQGQYSLSRAQVEPGGVYYRATFQPNPGSFVLPQSRVSAPRSLALRVPSLTTGSITNSSYSASCSAVDGALTYEWQENGSTVQDTSSRSLTRTGRSEDASYVVRVRAVAVTPNGTVTSNFSGTRTANTGRDEVRVSGTSGWIYKNETARGQHRKDVGWGYVGNDMRQGYYSSPYGGDGYIGVADYGSNGVKNAIVNAIGSTKWSKGSCADVEVYLRKESGIGTGGSVQVGFYTSDSGAGGGRPNREGSKVTRTSTSSGSGKWYDIGTAHGNRLGNGNSRSVVIYQSSSPTGNYASFNGGDTGRLRIKWKWNYVSQSAISPSWS